MSRLYPHAGNAHVIGITGSPGAGKSSLVNGLLKAWRQAGKKVAVIAVDPTSPFSGGALLGDRVRMRDHEADDGVFIRSMGTRGSLGGLSEACQDVVRLLDAARYDHVVVETVGVGQAELDIMKTADTVALVLYPSGGDVIQAFKAGIMEIADVFIINKADLPGKEQLRGELEDLLHLTERKEEWIPPIFETVSTENTGMRQVTAGMKAHHDYLASSGKKAVRRLRQKEQEVMKRLQEQFSAEITPVVKQAFLTSKLDDSLRVWDPYGQAETIFKQWKQQFHINEEEKHE